MSLNIWDEDLIKSFIDGKLIIDCKEIKLTQNTTENPEIWIGSGSLTIHPRNGISGRFICDRVLPPFYNVIKSSSLKSGELIPDSYYYSLSVTDVNGNVWINPVVDVKTQVHEISTVIVFTCDWIKTNPKTVIQADQKDYVKLLFLEKLKFPLNECETVNKQVLDENYNKVTYPASSGEAGGAEIKYKQVIGEYEYSFLTARGDNGTKLPIAFEHRLIESLRFVCAKNVSWSICESVTNGIKGIEIASTSNLERGVFPYPLQDRRDLSVDFYKLLDCYLNYAISQNTNENFSNISIKMGSLYQLKGVSLDSVALLISVAIESLVQEEFKTMAAVSSTLKTDVKTIKDCLKDLAIQAATMLRAEGILSSLLASRAIDKLYELKDMGVVDESDIKVWKSLRNKSAHGSLHIAPNEYQELIDHVYFSAVIINKLVFYRIKYSGKYTDYSKDNWPIAEFLCS